MKDMLEEYPQKKQWREKKWKYGGVRVDVGEAVPKVNTNVLRVPEAKEREMRQAVFEKIITEFSRTGEIH